MKKESIFGIVMYLLIFAFAVVYGFTVLQRHFQNSAMTAVWQYALYIIGCIVVGIILSAILFEFGHALGAKAGGYKIVKFTILYFTIYVDNGKHKFGFRRFNGLTGETLIVPNYAKKALQYFWNSFKAYYKMSASKRKKLLNPYHYFGKVLLLEQYL
jgi:hypothetical protein